MKEMTEKPKNSEQIEHQDSNFIGVLLLIIGVLAFLINIVQSEILGLLILPGLGIAFLAWGFYTRRFGFVIPGCILTGLGIGVFLTDRILTAADSGAGGIVVLGLALGFLGISLAAPFFGEKRVWWPLIPGAVLGFVGILLIIGGDALKILEWFGIAWPVILVLVGLYILFAPRLRQT